jgi:hypothetical protein
MSTYNLTMQAVVDGVKHPEGESKTFESLSELVVFCINMHKRESTAPFFGTHELRTLYIVSENHERSQPGA